ncbi:hypothetical protein KJ765_06380 [Candidatus Micrarchaeota archaeon]|nr:hypothetical protein [Candidatus Micrarchaeota archaeon]
MAAFSLFGKKAISMTGAMYRLDYEVHPMKLRPHHADYLNLEIEIQNVLDKELLTSIVIVIPKQLGLDPSALSHEKEIRLGLVASQETKFLKIPIYTTQRTKSGRYPVHLYAISHYRDYGYVLNEMKRQIDIRVE